MLITIFDIDSKFIPSFAENTATKLKKNYLDIYPWADYLKKNAACVINQCGFFKYPVGVDESECEKIDETEWCEVEVASTGDFGDNLTSYIKACDLEILE